MFQQPDAQGVLPPPLAFSKTEPNDMSNMSTPAHSSKKRSLESQSPVDDEKTMLADDDKIAKKQRRLVKNREAAAQFRHRQKAYMQKLEKHAEDLTLSNVQVTAKIELLDTENKLMKEQLNYLRNFMKQAVALSFPGNTTLPSLPPDSVVPPDPVSLSTPLVPNLAVIPDLFPDSPNANNERKETSVPVKPEPPNAGSLVPDITNNTSVTTINPSMLTHASSSSSSSVPSTVTPTALNPSMILSTPTTTVTPPPPLMAPPTIIPTHHHAPTHPTPVTKTPPPPPPSNPLITSTSVLADPLGASSALGSSSALSLSSIFNNVLGTDLSFSGVLVKTEPPFGESAHP